MLKCKDRKNIVPITCPNIFIHDHLGFGYKYGLGRFRELDTFVNNAVVFNQIPCQITHIDVCHSASVVAE